MNLVVINEKGIHNKVLVGPSNLQQNIYKNKNLKVSKSSNRDYSWNHRDSNDLPLNTNVEFLDDQTKSALSINTRMSGSNPQIESRQR